MKIKIIFFFFLTATLLFGQDEWIRVNQIGYLPSSIKAAVFLSKDKSSINQFEIWDADKNQKVKSFSDVEDYGEYGNFGSSFRLDFSDFHKEGKYFLKAGNVLSPTFNISKDVYDGTADILLNYMRQQRCGYNPFLKDSCHTEDGFIVDHLTLDSVHIDVTGGWHDASDYLQYLPTSANAVHQMLFAYQQNPESFGDKFNASGLEGENGIPDILDEAKWGLDWMVKMNPDSAMMFNQIADDRDHAGYRLPTKDSVDYGKGLERPVYFITGEKQGLCGYKNRTQGVSSSAGKYASSFALGAQILKKYYPKFTDTLSKKAKQAYGFANTNYGATQTASCKSPYFYEEDNYVDDLELAAIQLYKITGDEKYLTDAVKWGIVEPTTPWMGADTASHYQWYPFVNLGHYYIAESGAKDAKRFSEFMEKGLNEVFEEGKDNPFLIGIPFIWCSNNLIAGLLTQAHLYQEITGDDQYAEMEAALRDWLFGANPWGTSMIVALPENGDYPEDIHSALTTLYGYRLDGGLVDGPVYSTIFNKLRGIQLHGGDEYENVQPGMAVYHDDYGDYSTNEPTMDGTASLTYYLSALEKEGELKKK